MTMSSQPSPKRRATTVALLLLLATASGCGVLPTQPSLDSTADTGRGTTSAGTLAMELDPVVIDGGAGEGGSSSGGDETAPEYDARDTTAVVILPAIRPGNSEWGHSHKKPKN